MATTSKLIRDYPDRIGYVHLKQVDPKILAEVEAEGVGLDEAVRRGVMCEPPNGIPELPPVLDALAALDVDLFAIVEQDMYPLPTRRAAADRGADVGLSEIPRGWRIELTTSRV